MMLVQLPAMDTVQGLSLTDSLPSLSSLSGPLTILSHLAKPSVLLTLLASLVILSSIRAALLFMRPLPQQKGSISLVQSVVLATDKVVVGGVISSGPSPTSSAVKGKQPEKSTIVVPSTTADKKTISWCWGLLKWDSLPGLPTNVRNRINGVSMSEEERGWQLQQRGRRPGPAFEHPLPALYQSDVPVSMAKMIMSRHTFRRPTSRPPPVRSTSVPQYQRRMPSMV